VKYIEDEFSTCGSYNGSSQKRARVRPICDTAGFHERLIAPYVSARPTRPECGYLKYKNWSLTEKSRVFDGKAVSLATGCPFRGSGQQLWRNLLLAEEVARARGLDEFHFWVLAPVENTFLWDDHGRDVEADLRSVLTGFGQTVFRRIDLGRDVVDVLKPLVKGDMAREPRGRSRLGRLPACGRFRR
jgi:hypothetical protein